MKAVKQQPQKQSIFSDHVSVEPDFKHNVKSLLAFDSRHGYNLIRAVMEHIIKFDTVTNRAVFQLAEERKIPLKLLNPDVFERSSNLVSSSTNSKYIKEVTDLSEHAVAVIFKVKHMLSGNTAFNTYLEDKGLLHTNLKPEEFFKHYKNLSLVVETLWAGVKKSQWLHTSVVRILLEDNNILRPSELVDELTANSIAQRLNSIIDELKHNRFDFKVASGIFSFFKQKRKDKQFDANIALLRKLVNEWVYQEKHAMLLACTEENHEQR